MRRILKRFTGLFCVLALCLSMLPVSALAAEDAPSNQSTTLLSVVILMTAIFKL